MSSNSNAASSSSSSGIDYSQSLSKIIPTLASSNPSIKAVYEALRNVQSIQVKPSRDKDFQGRGKSKPVQLREGMIVLYQTLFNLRQQQKLGPNALHRFDSDLDNTFAFNIQHTTARGDNNQVPVYNQSLLNYFNGLRKQPNHQTQIMSSKSLFRTLMPSHTAPLHSAGALLRKNGVRIYATEELHATDGFYDGIILPLSKRLYDDNNLLRIDFSLHNLEAALEQHNQVKEFLAQVATKDGSRDVVNADKLRNYITNNKLEIDVPEDANQEVLNRVIYDITQSYFKKAVDLILKAGKLADNERQEPSPEQARALGDLLLQCYKRYHKASSSEHHRDTEKGLLLHRALAKGDAPKTTTLVDDGIAHCISYVVAALDNDTLPLVYHMQRLDDTRANITHQTVFQRAQIQIFVQLRHGYLTNNENQFNQALKKLQRFNQILDENSNYDQLVYSLIGEFSLDLNEIDNDLRQSPELAFGEKEQSFWRGMLWGLTGVDDFSARDLIEKEYQQKIKDSDNSIEGQFALAKLHLAKQVPQTSGRVFAGFSGFKRHIIGTQDLSVAVTLAQAAFTVAVARKDWPMAHKVQTWLNDNSSQFNDVESTMDSERYQEAKNQFDAHMAPILFREKLEAVRGKHDRLIMQIITQTDEDSTNKLIGQLLTDLTKDISLGEYKQVMQSSSQQMDKINNYLEQALNLNLRPHQMKNILLLYKALKNAGYKVMTTATDANTKLPYASDPSFILDKLIEAIEKHRKTDKTIYSEINIEEFKSPVEIEASFSSSEGEAKGDKTVAASSSSSSTAKILQADADALPSASSSSSASDHKEAASTATVTDEVARKPASDSRMFQRETPGTNDGDDKEADRCQRLDR